LSSSPPLISSYLFIIFSAIFPRRCPDIDGRWKVKKYIFAIYLMMMVVVMVMMVMMAML